MTYKPATTDAEFMAGKADRRRAGVDARNARKLARITPKCRYVDEVPGGLCRSEAADPHGRILLCQVHLARALETITALANVEQIERVGLEWVTR